MTHEKIAGYLYQVLALIIAGYSFRDQDFPGFLLSIGILYLGNELLKDE